MKEKIYKNFLWEIIKYVKDILIYKSSRKLSIYSESEIANIEKLASEVNKRKITSNGIYIIKFRK